MILTVDESLHIPVYEQLRQQIADGIISGDLSVGERLAPIRQLAKDLGLAPGTVARAYRELEAAELIITEGRSGSFVTAIGRAAATRTTEISRTIEACARRLERLGVSSDEAAALLIRRMG